MWFRMRYEGVLPGLQHSADEQSSDCSESSEDMQSTPSEGEQECQTERAVSKVASSIPVIDLGPEAGLFKHRSSGVVHIQRHTVHSDEHEQLSLLRCGRWVSANFVKLDRVFGSEATRCKICFT